MAVNLDIQLWYSTLAFKQLGKLQQMAKKVIQLRGYSACGAFMTGSYLESLLLH